VRIVGRNGVRVQGVDDFLQGAYETTLSTGDIIMGFDIPAPPRSFRWGFSKVARKSGAFAHSLAVVVAEAKDIHVRAVLGAAGSRPKPLVATAAQLEIPNSTENDIRAAIKVDLQAYFGELDEYQKRMHTANVLHAARNMRAQ
jgi:carbon-monoxide dehydrogenase medium subunit